MAQQQIISSDLQAAQEAFTHLRQTVDRFHRVRATTYAALHGGMATSIQGPILSRYVSDARNHDLELHAAQGLRDLLALLSGGEPTSEDLEAGPPDGMSLGLYSLSEEKLTLATAGATLLASDFDQLASIEEQIQNDLKVRVYKSPMERVVKTIGWAAIVGGVTAGLWFGYKAIAKPKEEIEEEEEEIEDEPEAEAEAEADESSETEETENDES